MALAAWLAHRLPSGDPLRATLPGVLTALRERLAHPGLLLALDRRGIDWEAFRRAASDPAETGDDFERHGAVVLGTERTEPLPAIRPALLDAAGHDPTSRRCTPVSGRTPRKRPCAWSTTGRSPNCSPTPATPWPASATRTGCGGPRTPPAPCPTWSARPPSGTASARTPPSST
ncbi:hypothetical protein ACFQ2H_41225 [Streptomyces violaceoruber]